MSDCLISCFSVILVFWLGFGLTYFTLLGRMSRLERRVRHIERQTGRNTEDVSSHQPQPKPIKPSRYISLDRQIDPQYFR